MHDISDTLDWDEAHKAYLAGEGETGERDGQRPEARHTTGPAQESPRG
jgi:hypothetical protein